MLRKNKKVAVMMSGGVDSSTAAALLKEKGFEVVGITLLLWDKKTDSSSIARNAELSFSDDVRDARRVCEFLDIEHQIIDRRADFRRLVVNPFEEAYLSGITPNPCVICNPSLKWGSIILNQLPREYDYIATGHYAKIVHGKDGVRLEKGLDLTKDQSYALWNIPRSALEKTIFPLGSWSKKAIREKASELNLPVAHKSESQDICFISDDYKKHLFKNQMERVKEIGKGIIVDSNGKELGIHDGFYNFTIGQRKGLNIRDGKGPYYVKSLNPQENKVIIGTNEDLFDKGCILKEVNWVSFDPPANSGNCTVKIRYNDNGSKAALHLDTNGQVSIIFDSPKRAVTPGQSAVWYRGRSLWGGGIIVDGIK